MWSLRPDWQSLLVITRDARLGRFAVRNIEVRVGDVGDVALVTQMNARGIRLCPPETEGYGHCLKGAPWVMPLVVTIDAPPMNELVDPVFGWRAAYSRNESMDSSTRYFVDPQALEGAVDPALSLAPEEKARRREQTRLAYLARRDSFRCALWLAVEQLAQCRQRSQRAHRHEQLEAVACGHRVACHGG